MNIDGLTIELGRTHSASKYLDKECPIYKQREIRRLRKNKVSVAMIAALEDVSEGDVVKMCGGIGHAEGRIDGGYARTL